MNQTKTDVYAQICEFAHYSRMETRYSRMDPKGIAAHLNKTQAFRYSRYRDASFTNEARWSA
jgi:hypothetical protein